jgi:hypothetical protein
MTPEEELARLNRVIHQYETVFRTTSDSEQRQRVEKQLRELKRHREQILAVNIIDQKAVRAVEESETLTDLPFLRTLVAREAELNQVQRLALLWTGEEPATPTQQEIYNLMLYMRWFRDEFLPFLTEKRLKLDYKYSIDRDGFYSRFQDVQRKLDSFGEENARLGERMAGHEIELEMRKRLGKLKREIEVDAAKFFHAVRIFARDLREDADGEGVKCLNGYEHILFDSIEGRRSLEGRTVRGALEEMARLASEIELYLNVPNIEAQES